MSKITYAQCLRGTVPAPAPGWERNLFQFLMVFGMVTSMVTFNWLLHHPEPVLADWIAALYEYPLTFGVALGVRWFVANPLLDRTAGRLIPQKLSGIARSLAMTLSNIFAMVTIMTFFGIIISNGIEGFTWAEYAASLPVGYAAAFVANWFIVAPCAKLGFYRLVRPCLRSIRAKKAPTPAIPRTLASEAE